MLASTVSPRCLRSETETTDHGLITGDHDSHPFYTIFSLQLITGRGRLITGWDCESDVFKYNARIKDCTPESLYCFLLRIVYYKLRQSMWTTLLTFCSNTDHGLLITGYWSRADHGYRCLRPPYGSFCQSADHGWSRLTVLAVKPTGDTVDLSMILITRSTRPKKKLTTNSKSIFDL